MARVLGVIAMLALLACGGAPSGPRGRSAVIIEGTSLVLVSADDHSIPIEIHFRVDSAVLENDSREVLGVLADFINAHSELKLIEIRGYSDPRGGEKHNLDLSKRRAEAVMTALTQNGVSHMRLQARGFGAQRASAAGESEADWRRDRRVELVIVR